jgi:hypothetical protein
MAVEAVAFAVAMIGVTHMLDRVAGRRTTRLR